MKRKTNLFYNSGPDSKFLTFSNYTEALTGNFLSTNTKLFPSTFLCLNIPSLTKENKKDFINAVLIAKYENKLATLRDKYGEENIFPLSYLLEYILDYDNTTTISYIGNITEQDYLGSYSDTICIIDTHYLQSAIIERIDKTDELSIDGETTLYGWYDTIDGEDVYTGPETYSDIKPIFDDNNKYNISKLYDVKYNISENVNNIDFNILIPLFNFVNTQNNNDILLNDETILTSDFKTNVPLGIWFGDKLISLDTDSTYGQSWSLAIGSQFKPLPTSSTVRSDVYKDPNTDAFKTFAQVLVRQNELLSLFEQQQRKYEDVLDELDELKELINNHITEN